ncbi:hypothetical protein IGI37_001415 [Enterococcus sp. AZ194]|uniref:hypothetical protein n=1 Tax=Enterococcus sp. AZ194 TaxID=2774629 RepID=UPI003F209A6B
MTNSTLNIVGEFTGEWTNKDGLIKHFEGLNKNILNVWLMEMSESQNFHQYVVNPTHKLVWINVEGFLLFLKWKASERGY